MKRLLCLTLALAMTTMVGCFDGYPSKELVSSETSSVVNVSSTPNKQFFGLNETAVFTDLKISAIELVESKGDDEEWSLWVPKDGNVFVGVKFVIENVSSVEQTVSSLLMFGAYYNDIKVEYSYTAETAFDDDGSLDGSLAPGRKMIGYYWVELPEEWNKLEIEVKQDWWLDIYATFVFNK